MRVDLCLELDLAVETLEVGKPVAIQLALLVGELHVCVVGAKGLDKYFFLAARPRIGPRGDVALEAPNPGQRRRKSTNVRRRKSTNQREPSDGGATITRWGPERGGVGRSEPRVTEQK